MAPISPRVGNETAVLHYSTTLKPSEWTLGTKPANPFSEFPFLMAYSSYLRRGR